MNTIIIYSALWFGMLTAISPCPLATNIAAVSLISRHLGNRSHALLAGLLYSSGRAIVYLLLASLIISGILEGSNISIFLQQYMNEIIGPFMIVLGVMLLGWLNISFGVNINSQKLQKRAEKNALLWSFPIGCLFALSFCPVSAGLFFGALIPLSIKHESLFMLPAIFGFGTAFPVLVFSVIIAFFSGYLSTAFDKMTKIEVAMRTTTGMLFIIAGIYYSIIHIYVPIIK